MLVGQQKQLAMTPCKRQGGDSETYHDELLVTNRINEYK